MSDTNQETGIQNKPALTEQQAKMFEARVTHVDLHDGAGTEEKQLFIQMMCSS